MTNTFGKRVQCSGNCGTYVLPEKGECRKCKRMRKHAGLKHISKSMKGNTFNAKVHRAWESMKSKFARVKSIQWNRPKRFVRGLTFRDKGTRRPSFMDIFK